MYQNVSRQKMSAEKIMSGALENHNMRFYSQLSSAVECLI